MSYMKTYKSFSAGELSPDMYGRFDVEKYGTGCMILKNWIIMSQGGVYKRPGTRFIAEAGDSTRKVRLIPFEFSTIQDYILEFGHNYMRVFKDGAQVLETEKTVTAATNANPAVLTITSHGYSTGDEVYLSGFTGGDWSDKLDGRGIKITVTGANTFSLNGIDSTAFGTWTAGKAARVYQISTPYGEDDLSSIYFAQTADVMTLCHKSYAIRELTRTGHTSWTITTPTITSSPFGADGSGNCPSVVSFHKQRRVFANTINKPETIFMSKANAFSDFTVSGADDDAIIFQIASGQVNKVKHLISFKTLLAMTTAQEWSIGSDGVLSPTTIDATPQTNYGTTDTPPIMIGNTAIFAARFGKRVRDYKYTFESDGYSGSDLSVLARHLIENKEIKEWDFAQEPDDIIWAVMTDGTVCTLTYMQEHKVFGWARHETDGLYESVAAVPSTLELRDTVYFVVKRTINGVEKRYIEILEQYIDDPSEDGFFLDSGLSYDGSATDTINGLWHLEGETVGVYADGNVLPDEVVTNGQVVTSHPYSKIHIGIRYDFELQPMPLESDQGYSGSTKGKPKQIKGVFLEVYKTRGLFSAQTKGGELNEISPIFQDGDLSLPILSQTTLLYTAVEPYWESTYVAPYIYDNYPTPAKILTMTPAYEL